jgi:hypothetical protein
MQVGNSIIGKRILVGLTYLDDAGAVREQVQHHGLITHVSESTLVFDRADGAGELSIPFEPEIDTADPEAVYTLSSTGEEVTGVDLLASWTINPPERAV